MFGKRETAPLCLDQPEQSGGDNQRELASNSALQSLQVLPLSFPVAMGNDVVQASSTCLFDEKSSFARPRVD